MVLRSPRVLRRLHYSIPSQGFASGEHGLGMTVCLILQEPRFRRARRQTGDFCALFLVQGMGIHNPDTGSHVWEQFPSAHEHGRLEMNSCLHRSDERNAIESSLPILFKHNANVSCKAVDEDLLGNSLRPRVYRLANFSGVNSDRPGLPNRISFDL